MTVCRRLDDCALSVDRDPAHLGPAQSPPDPALSSPTPFSRTPPHPSRPRPRPVQPPGYWSVCRMGVSCEPYPALSFSFISVIPSLDTSLLKTRIPITMLTCRRERERKRERRKTVNLPEGEKKNSWSSPSGHQQAPTHRSPDGGPEKPTYTPTGLCQEGWRESWP